MARKSVYCILNNIFIKLQYKNTEKYKTELKKKNQNLLE